MYKYAFSTGPGTYRERVGEEADALFMHAGLQQPLPV
jgi:hypothetical protein